MAGEQLLVLVILVTVLALILAGKNRQRVKRFVLDNINRGLEALKLKNRPVQTVAGIEPGVIREEERSRAELERLHQLIEDRKKIARDAEISHHLWGFYKSHFRCSSLQSLQRHTQDSDWYNVNVLKVGTENGLNRFEFELKGARYQLVDDEEQRGWCENIKLFSLFLYDDSDRCLIEIPMKMKVDNEGRKYSVLLDGPKAFLPGDWVNDFINAALKHQSIRNQEIRAQKHQERLSEIEDLKNRFGISN